MNIIIIVFFILYLFLSKREGYDFMDDIRDRFIDPMNHRYINQIDYYRDAPNINLERVLSNPTITEDDIDWSKVSDSEYPKLINYLSGRNDATSINAN